MSSYFELCHCYIKCTFCRPLMVLATQMTRRKGKVVCVKNKKLSILMICTKEGNVRLNCS
jgi:hypothetical protein